MLISDFSTGYGFNMVFRAKDATARKKIADACTKACKNNNIGYDCGRPDRKTLYTAAKNKNWQIDKITTKCETTCSELANVCLACAGLKHIGTGKDANVDNLTAFLKSDDQVKTYNSVSKNSLQVGDILRSDCHYAVVVEVR